MLGSSASFALVNWCVKYLDHIPVNELIFFRSIISLSICLYFVRKLKLPVLGNNKLWLLGRGVFGVSALTIFFFTIQNLDLASATVVQYMSPVFTVILAMYFFGEKVKPVQWFFFALALAGVLVMKNLKQGFNANDVYLLLGVCSAFLAAIAYNCIIKCRHTDHPITVVMYFPLLATPIMAVWCLFDWVTPQGNDWWLLLFIGSMTQVAQVCMTKALNAEDSSIVMPFKYVGAIWAFLISVFFFKKDFEPYTLIGIAMVLTGAILNSMVKKDKVKI